MTYDPDTYWIERGKTYEERFRRRAAHESQEAAIVDALRGKSFDTILEVGCGFGRIGEILVREFPDASYHGIDLSPDQVAGASRRLRGADAFVEVSSLEDFRAAHDRSVTPEPYDLVVAVEVLMHQPPDRVAAFVERLRRLSRRYVLTCDWDVPLERAAAPHNFLHDYAALIPTAKRVREAGPRQGVWIAKGLVRG